MSGKLYELSKQGEFILDRNVLLPILDSKQSSSASSASITSLCGYNKSKKVEDIDVDTEILVSLCLETISAGKSVLLFCPSKKRCEVCAEMISKSIQEPKNPKLLILIEALNQRMSSTKIGTTTQLGRLHVLEMLKNSSVGLCSTIQKLILNGIAYHHAGLTVEERKIIECGFREGFINVLATTSTLAAGVNLPAHRVIIRTPQMGHNDLSVAAFRQMCGRAGRMNLDTDGEAILMITDRSHERQLAAHLVLGEMQCLTSALKQGIGGLEKLILEVITCRKITCESQLVEFISCTLLSIQNSDEAMLEWTNQAINFIRANKFVLSLPEIQPGIRPLIASGLGTATVFSGINPKHAVEVLQSLIAGSSYYNLIVRYLWII